MNDYTIEWNCYGLLLNLLFDIQLGLFYLRYVKTFYIMRSMSEIKLIREVNLLFKKLIGIIE